MIYGPSSDKKYYPFKKSVSNMLAPLAEDLNNQADADDKTTSFDFQDDSYVDADSDPLEKKEGEEEIEEEEDKPPLLDLEDSFLPDHILKFREMIYSKLNELLIQCMQYVIQEYHFVFTPDEAKKMVREFNNLIETRYTTLKGNRLYVPLHLSSEGINGFIGEFMEAICQIMAPAVWKALVSVEMNYVIEK
jgi:hypothetical protein